MSTKNIQEHHSAESFIFHIWFSNSYNMFDKLIKKHLSAARDWLNQVILKAVETVRGVTLGAAAAMHRAILGAAAAVHRATSATLNWINQVILSTVSQAILTAMIWLGRAAVLTSVLVIAGSHIPDNIIDTFETLGKNIMNISSQPNNASIEFILFVSALLLLLLLITYILNIKNIIYHIIGMMMLGGGIFFVHLLVTPVGTQEAIIAGARAIINGIISGASSVFLFLVMWQGIKSYRLSSQKGGEISLRILAALSAMSSILGLLIGVLWLVSLSEPRSPDINTIVGFLIGMLAWGSLLNNRQESVS